MGPTTRHPACVGYGVMGLLGVGLAASPQSVSDRPFGLALAVVFGWLSYRGFRGADERAFLCIALVGRPPFRFGQFNASPRRRGLLEQVAAGINAFLASSARRGVCGVGPGLRQLVVPSPMRGGLVGG